MAEPKIPYYLAGRPRYIKVLTVLTPLVGGVNTSVLTPHFSQVLTLLGAKTVPPWVRETVGVREAL